MFALKILYRSLSWLFNDIKNGSFFRWPNRVYYVNPHRIEFHTNREELADMHFKERVFNMERDRGRYIGGNWDDFSYRFEDLETFKAFRSRLCEHKDWSETAYYKEKVEEVHNNERPYGCTNLVQLDRKFAAFDTLVEQIRSGGFKSTAQLMKAKGILYRLFSFYFNDEICVNIGRKGDIYFQNGRHRLSIAKLLKLENIPVTVLVVHADCKISLDKIFNQI